ncbi:MAG: hypothetical protein II466_07355 [Bacteroidales bacterium]|nr:hypothetical protein [Bacteroidales bacterium]
MKRIFSAVIIFIAVAVVASAQGNFATPADTVYLKDGNKVVAHIKRIENEQPEKGFGYQVYTHESFELLGKDIWAQGNGGYQWISEKYREGWWGVELEKIVFADGFVLPFRGGQIDRSLLIRAPRFSGSHGNVFAEGVIELDQNETRAVLGDRAYYQGYQAYKRQASTGLVKALVGGPMLFGCYITRNNATKTYKDVPVTGLGVVGADYAEKKEMKALWHTALPFSIVTTVYGIGEMLIYNNKIRKISSDFKSFTGVSEAASRTKIFLGAGLAVAGVAVTYFGYKRINDKGTWYNLYSYDNYNQDLQVRKKIGTKGSKPSATWLMPAAGALLMNFGVSQLTSGLNGLRGSKIMRDLGLDRAEVNVGFVSGGMGICMTF